MYAIRSYYGPIAGPNGGPGVAFPPSMRISTVSFAINLPPSVLILSGHL